MGTKTQTTALDVLIDQLRQGGVTQVFGVAGAHLHAFFSRIEEDSDFRFLVAKNEQSAAFMADGYARAGGKLAVCASSSAPGAAHLLPAISAAYADGVPMLVITGRAADGALQADVRDEAARARLDFVTMFRRVTKYSHVVPDANSMGHHVRNALRIARTGRPGPVHLQIPTNVLRHYTPGFTDSELPEHTPVIGLDRNTLALATDRLAAAQAPLILAGSGARSPDVRLGLVGVAEALDANVATTPKGKGVFPEDHPLALGVVGIGGHARARDAFASSDHDVLLAVGTSLGESSTLGWDPVVRQNRALIQLDIDPELIGRNYPVSLSIVADAGPALDQLAKRLHIAREVSGVQMKLPAERAIAARSDPMSTSRATPVTPQRWRRDLEAVLEKDALIFSDIGAHTLFNIHCLQLRHSQQFFVNLGFGSMGHGMVAPIGAALANPRHPVVAIVGDASFTMSGMELLAALEYDINVVWIVENNQMHGMTHFASANISPSGLPLRSAAHTKAISIYSIATGMGVPAWRVREPGAVASAYAEARRTRGPCVIEVEVDPTIQPPTLPPRASKL